MTRVHLKMVIMPACLAVNRFGILFVLKHWPIVYIVLHCCLGRYFPFSFLVYFFGLFLLFQFFTTSFISLDSTIMRAGYVRPHTHTYKPCTHRYDSCTISIDSSIGHETGRLRPSKKHTRATTELFQGFHPDPTQT